MALACDGAARADLTMVKHPSCLIERHIPWVLLAGDTACKIKKPVTLPFVNYGPLIEFRKHQRNA